MSLLTNNYLQTMPASVSLSLCFFYSPLSPYLPHSLLLLSSKNLGKQQQQRLSRTTILVLRLVVWLLMIKINLNQNNNIGFTRSQGQTQNNRE